MTGPTYGKKSYIILHQDGTRSDEIFFEDTQPFHGFAFMSFVYIKNSIISRSVSKTKLARWLKKHDSGLSLKLAVNQYGYGTENIWLKERGIGGIIGDVVLVAYTYTSSDTFSDGDIPIPVKETISVAETYLANVGVTHLNCLIDLKRAMDASNYVIDKYGVANTSLTTNIITDGWVKCTTCDNNSDNSSDMRLCPCGRAHYCSQKCQYADWKIHKKIVHKGGRFL